MIGFYFTLHSPFCQRYKTPTFTPARPYRLTSRTGPQTSWLWPRNPFPGPRDSRPAADTAVYRIPLLPLIVHRAHLLLGRGNGSADSTVDGSRKRFTPVGQPRTGLVPPWRDALHPGGHDDDAANNRACRIDISQATGGQPLRLGVVIQPLPNASRGKAHRVLRGNSAAARQRQHGCQCACIKS
jgi:hypothetical protein